MKKTTTYTWATKPTATKTQPLNLAPGLILISLIVLAVCLLNLVELREKLLETRTADHRAIVTLQSQFNDALARQAAFNMEVRTRCVWTKESRAH